MRRSKYGSPARSRCEALNILSSCGVIPDDQLEYIKVFNDVKTLYNDLKSL